MKNNKKLTTFLTLLSTGMVLGLVSCGGTSSAPEGSTSQGGGSGGVYEKQYTITFNALNGATNAITRSMGKKGTVIDLPQNLSYAGHSFLGWSSAYDKTAKTGDATKLLEGTTYTIEESNRVFYGTWKKAEQETHTSEEILAYMEDLKSTSEDGHLYVHYYRWDHNEDDYKKWDIWSWPYRPSEGEGYKFEYSGMDGFGGAIYDIDMTQTYDGGWDDKAKTIGGTEVSFYADEGKSALDTQVGIQIVKSETRSSGGGFWVNDGGNVYVTLDDYALPVNGGGKSYHVFCVQDSVQSYTARPLTSEERVDPFENDDGTNVTKGDSTYDDADWVDKPIAKTAPAFKNIGTGYQIMVSSFADSDNDGFGDIYGITQKLDYLDKLGVKALWLTPVQKSDSYHGYDISDYEKVDTKFGSAKSTAGLANGGIVTEATAMADYEELIEEAGKRGMKIVMDLVLNHTSTSNSWFVKSAQLNPEYRGYYQWANHEVTANIDEDHSWYQYGDHPYSYYAKFGSGMPELNYSYKSTREAVEDMTLFWCEKGVGGFRLDAVKHIFMEDECNVAAGDTVISDLTTDKKTGKPVNYSSDLTKNLNFYKELNAVVKEKFPDAFFVGENFDGTAYAVGPYYEAFDSMFDFYTYFNLTSIAKGTDVGGYASGFMRGASLYQGSGKEFNGHTMKWNAVDVFKNYDQWRGDSALPGIFTSNHDIARVVNRIAGTGDSTGIQAQGKVTTDSFDWLNKKAMAVKLTEILMPGLTWVYYGDEIGMTGNFLMNAETADDDYADLAYRQPMKWVDAGVVGDGSFTTSYSINGAKSNIYWDEVNESSKVVPAMSQAASESSDFAVLAKAIKLKQSDPSALITGSFEDDNTQDRVLKFTRSGGGKTYHVETDFDASTVKVTLNGNVVFSY